MIDGSELHFRNLLSGLPPLTFLSSIPLAIDDGCLRRNMGNVVWWGDEQLYVVGFVAVIAVYFYGPTQH